MLTLTHQASGINFELPENISIPFVFTNPAVAEHDSVSLSFSLKNNPVNAMLTGYPHLPGAPDNSNSIPVILNIDGAIKHCVLEIITSTETDIKANLTFNESVFFSQHGDKNLRDCDFGEDIDLVELHSEGDIDGLPAWSDDMYTKQWPQMPVAFFPIHNSDFFSGSEAWDEIYKLYGKIQNKPVDMQFHPEGSTSLPGKYFPVTPFPYVVEINKRLITNLNYYVDFDFLTTNNLKHLVLVNFNDITDCGITYLQHFSLYTKYFHQRYFNIKNHVPNLTINEYFKDLAAKFNVHAYFNENNKTFRLINLDTILNGPIKSDLSEYFFDLELTKIPNISGCSFIMSGFKSNELTHRSINYSDVKDFIISNRIYTYEELTAPGSEAKYNEVRVVEVPEYRYYQLQWHYDSETNTSEASWFFLGLVDFADIIIGNSTNALKFETKINYTLNSPRLIYYKTPEGTADNTSLFNFPVVDTLGYSSINPDSKRQDSVCYAFNLGMNGPGDYPVASYGDAWDSTEHTMNLRFGGDKGLINNFFKHTIEMRMKKGKLFKSKVWMPASILFGFDYAEKYKIGAGSYIVGKISGNFTNNGIEYKEAELIEV